MKINIYFNTNFKQLTGYERDTSKHLYFYCQKHNRNRAIENSVLGFYISYFLDMNYDLRQYFSEKGVKYI